MGTITTWACVNIDEDEDRRLVVRVDLPRSTTGWHWLGGGENWVQIHPSIPDDLDASNVYNATGDRIELAFGPPANEQPAAGWDVIPAGSRVVARLARWVRE